MPRVRLDSLLAERGLFESRSRAAAAILAGAVHVGPGRRRAEKPGQLVEPTVELAVDGPPPFVSRGGVKLANALDALGVPVAGRRCLDVGASTGGFTDCLLQRGAEAVVALDVAYGELHWRLREDPRVVVLERVNARALEPSQLPWRPSLVVVDVSFISLRTVLPAVLACGAPEFDCLAMVKPQFEVGRGRSGGVASCAIRRCGARRSSTWRARRRRRARPCAASRPRGSPGRRGTARRSCGWPRPGGAVEDVAAAAGGRRMSCRTATVLTHRRVSDTEGALRELIDRARAAGVLLRFDASRRTSTGWSPRRTWSSATPSSPPPSTCASCSAATARS